MAPRRHHLLLAGAAATILVAGCSADDADPSAGSLTAVAEAGGADLARSQAAPEADEQGERGQPADDSDDLGTLQIIYRGSITLSSDDPDETVAQVRERATELGGFVASADLRRNDLGLLTGSITIRVPAANFDLLRTRVSETAADVVAETASTNDVTDRLRDLDATVRNLEALEEQLVALLEDARLTGDPSQIVEVFDRISEVRGEIERIEATRADLEDRVAMSTLTVRVRPSRTIVAQAQQVPDEDRPLPWSPGNEAETAWDTTVVALQGFVSFLIALVVTVLPVALVWLMPVVLLVLAARAWLRRRPRSGDGGSWRWRPSAAGPKAAPGAEPESEPGPTPVAPSGAPRKADDGDG